MQGVVVASVAATVLAAYPDTAWFAIAAGIAAGLLSGAAIGLLNGVGVGVFNVNPFIMTVGMLSILSGVALTLSGGMPIYGLPKQSARSSPTPHLSVFPPRCCSRADCSS